MTQTATAPTTVDASIASLSIAEYDKDGQAFSSYSAGEHLGPSPWADTTDKGPSVLPGYKPLKQSGKLEAAYPYTELTPGLGREYYKDARLVDILNDDELLQDLAIAISERGVVFFKDQRDLSVEQQKQLADKLGKAGGKPASAGLHVHPTAFRNGLVNPETKNADPEVLVLDSQRNIRTYNKSNNLFRGSNRLLGAGFHSDITFEPVPASYAVLRLTETPSSRPTDPGNRKGNIGGSGGDTLWASGYGLAEKLSEPFLKFLEGLTGEYSQPGFEAAVKTEKVPFWSAERGAPENVGHELTATHPLVRTNPVTGWKSVFAIGEHFASIQGLSPSESDSIRTYLLQLLVASPELQLRYHWDQFDVAIWDNRSTYHAIISDLLTPEGEALERVGLRTLSLGERPFLDPNSKLRRDALQSERPEKSGKPEHSEHSEQSEQSKKPEHSEHSEHSGQTEQSAK